MDKKGKEQKSTKENKVTEANAVTLPPAVQLIGWQIKEITKEEYYIAFKATALHNRGFDVRNYRGGLKNVLNESIEIASNVVKGPFYVATTGNKTIYFDSSSTISFESSNGCDIFDEMEAIWGEESNTINKDAVLVVVNSNVKLLRFTGHSVIQSLNTTGRTEVINSIFIRSENGRYINNRPKFTHFTIKNSILIDVDASTASVFGKAIIANSRLLESTIPVEANINKTTIENSRFTVNYLCVENANLNYVTVGGYGNNNIHATIDGSRISGEFGRRLDIKSISLLTSFKSENMNLGINIYHPIHLLVCENMFPSLGKVTVTYLADKGALVTLDKVFGSGFSKEVVISPKDSDVVINNKLLSVLEIKPQETPTAPCFTPFDKRKDSEAQKEIDELTDIVVSRMNACRNLQRLVDM